MSLALVLASTPAAARRYDGHAIVRVQVQSPAELAIVTAIADEVWTHRPGPGAVDVRVAPGRLAELRATGLPHEIRIADAQARIDVERSRLAAAPDPAAGGAWFADFRDYEAIMTQLDAMAASAPEIAEVIDLGDSLEGRAIRGLRIGKGGAGAPAVLYTGTMHAREWLATMTSMCVADAFLSGYGTDDHVTALVDDLEIVVVPVLNPDGYVVSWTADRYWRKNTRDGYGVDLNRNFGHAWGGAGASGNPYDETYHGEGPFSEPESAVLRDFVELHGGFVAHVDFHSFAQLVLYPWGYTYDAAPDEPALAMLADGMSAAIAQSTGASYPAIQGSDLYPAAGAVDDWAYGDAGMMAFTIELRGDDFVVPPSEIAAACAENVAAALVVADWAHGQVPTEPDDTTGGGDEHGDEHADPTLDDGGLDDGTTSTADDGTTEGEADVDDGAPLDDEPDALPPGFGLDGDRTGCAIAPRMPAWWWLALLVVRRRYGTQ